MFFTAIQDLGSKRHNRWKLRPASSYRLDKKSSAEHCTLLSQEPGPLWSILTWLNGENWILNLQISRTFLIGLGGKICPLSLHGRLALLWVRWAGEYWQLVRITSSWLSFFLGKVRAHSCQSVPPAQVQYYRGPWISSSRLWNHSAHAVQCSQPCIKSQLHRRLMNLKPFRPAINFSFSASLTSGKSVSKEPAAAVTLTGKSTVPSHPLATRTGEGME